MNEETKKVLEAVAKGPTYREQCHGYSVDVCSFCKAYDSEEHKHDCPVPIAQELLKDTHPHLSAEQKAKTRVATRENILDRIVEGDLLVAGKAVDAWLDTLSIEEQLGELMKDAYFRKEGEDE